MANLGASVVATQAGRVLLVKREDFEVWTIPGGEVDPGETPAQAAMREAREETGLAVRLTRLVGVYARPSWDIVSIVFAAEVVGGSPAPALPESVDVGLFEIDALPAPLLWWTEAPIRDALSGTTGAVCRIETSFPFPGRTRAEVYALRDGSGLRRVDFYHSHFGRRDGDRVVDELG